MPRYFFDTHNGDHLIQDTEGIELQSRDAARRQALDGLKGIASDETPGKDQCNCYVNVRNEADIPIYTACMALIGRWLD